MGRSPCCAKEGLNRGAWTVHEDKILVDYIKTHGEGRWRNLPRKAGLKRCGKSCRLRWLNYLRPGIKRGNISPEEEELIIRLHKLLGNRWSLIAGRLPGRTDNEIKNYWNTNLVKKVKDHKTSLGSLTRKISSNKPSQQTAKKVDAADHQQGVSPAADAKDLSSTPKMATQVVRTKASKCSKVIFIDPQQPDEQPQVGQWLDPSTSIEARPSSVEAQIPPVKPIESATFHGLPTFACGGNNSDKNNQDLIVDFTADFLNSYELSEFSEFSYHNDNGNDFSPPSSHRPMATMLPEEMLQDWSAEASCDQPAAVLASSLNSWSASFFDSEEEWLVEY